ncbi:MAG: rubredoxin-NAD+ reductase, partial [Granulosicoccus sp.]
MNLVIIGTGMAGYTLAREVRKKDPLARITLITRDNGDSYSKPMLSNALAVGKSPEQLILSPAAKMAAQYDLQVLVQTQVTGIDRDRQQVLTDQGPV